jgi:5'-nucleotidase / UDP-sugar diphosphatase
MHALLPLWVIASVCAATKVTNLTIVHTTHIRSRLLPVNPFGVSCSLADSQDGGPESCSGGAARRATFVRGVQSAVGANGTIVVDVGCRLHGSLFFSMFRGLADAEEMIATGTDVLGLDKCEFFAGQTALAGFIRALGNRTSVVSSNLRVKQGTPLAGGTQPIAIVSSRGGRKVAFVSLVAPDLVSSTRLQQDSARNVSVVEGVRMVDHMNVLLHNMSLQHPDCNIVVLLSNLRESGNSAAVLAAQREEEHVLHYVKGIDVVIRGSGSGGGLATDGGVVGGSLRTNAFGHNVLVVGHGSVTDSSHIGRLDLSFDDEGHLLRHTSVHTKLTSANTANAPDVLARVVERKSAIDTMKARRVGSSLTGIDGTRGNASARVGCRFGDCEAGVLLTRAMLHACGTCDIAVFNGGGIRASLPRGNVSLAALNQMAPFEDTGVRLRMTGALLWKVARRAVQLGEGSGGFLQLAGVRIFAHRRNNPGRLLALQVLSEQQQWVAVPDNNRTSYWVVTTFFLAHGGDGYAGFKGATARSTIDLSVWSMLEKYIVEVPRALHAVDLRACYHEYATPATFARGGGDGRGVCHSVRAISTLGCKFGYLDAGRRCEKEPPSKAYTDTELFVGGGLIALVLVALATAAARWWRVRGRPQVMISYRHLDAEFAHRVEAHLLSSGFRVWIDTAITPGNDWREDIATAIRESAAVVFILTPASVQSKYCKEELYFASGLGKPIFPIVLEDAFDAMAGGAKTILQRKQWIDFKGDFGPAAGKLVTELRKAQGGPGRPKRSKATAKQPAAAGGHGQAAAKRLRRLSTATPHNMRTPRGTSCTEVFVCFDQADAAIAQVVRDAFTGYNVAATLAQRVGQTPDFEANAGGLEAAHTFCFVMSESSVRNEVCGEELHAAYELDKRLVAVVVGSNAQQLLAQRGSMALMLEMVRKVNVDRTDCAHGMAGLLACYFKLQHEESLLQIQAGTSSRPVGRLLRTRSSKVLEERDSEDGSSLSFAGLEQGLEAVGIEVEEDYAEGQQSTGGRPTLSMTTVPSASGAVDLHFGKSEQTT